MRVLVTGHSGFLGKHVMRELKSRGHDTVPPLLHDGLRRANLTKQFDAEVMIQETKPDAVIHLAAKCGGIGANMDRPGDFFRDNMLMGINLIEACRRTGIRKLLVVGTVCSYPHTPPRIPFIEDDLWESYPEPTNASYGIAKKALLTMLQAYRQQYGMNGIYLIPVNLYGSGDCFDPTRSHVIPAMMLKLHNAKECGDKSVMFWGTGKASREFLHATDAAMGIVAAMERYDGEDPVNLGNGQEYTIADLATKIAEIVGYKGEILWDPSKPDGQPRRCLDISRAKERFGFEAKIGLEEGLRETYQWFLKQPMAQEGQ